MTPFVLTRDVSHRVFRFLDGRVTDELSGRARGGPVLHADLADSGRYGVLRGSESADRALPGLAGGPGGPGSGTEARLERGKT